MVIEKITKRSVYSEVAWRILRPLALTRTVPSDKRSIPGLITGYSMPDSPFGFEGPTIKDGMFVINPQFEWTGGGFASTAEELARWAKALYGGRVLNRDMLNEMLTAVEARTGRGDKYGLGVQVRQSDFGVSYGHGGWFPGYRSEMEYFPDHKIAIAVQFNTDNGRALKRPLRAYIAEVARVVIGAAPVNRSDLRSSPPAWAISSGAAESERVWARGKIKGTSASLWPGF